MPETIDEERTAVLFIRARNTPRNLERYRLGIVAQRQHGERTAERLGATIIGEYVVISGTRERITQDTIQAMCDEVAHHPVNYVITAAMDRLTRDVADAMAFMNAIGASGAQLVVDGEPVSTELAALFTSPVRERSPQ